MTTETEHAVCARYASRIHMYGLRHLRDRTAAEDLVQHVLLAVLQALREDRVADRSRLDAYVLGTCRNAVMELRRGDVRRRKLAEQAAIVALRECEPSVLPVDRERLDTCLRKLEPRERAVVMATFLDEKCGDEIARDLGLTTGNVRVIRHRALAHLQTCVEGGRHEM